MGREAERKRRQEEKCQGKFFIITKKAKLFSYCKNGSELQVIP